MNDGENRLNGNSVDAFNQLLNDIEGDLSQPLALVTTGEGKFFSAGGDLDWMESTGTGAHDFVDSHIMPLYIRLLGFPAVIVAAINGHAFAGGAMLASVHDIKVMRRDRGWWCLPEVDIGGALTTPLYDLVAATVPASALREALVTGHRYTGEEAKAAGIVDHAVEENELLDLAVAIASEYAGKDRKVISRHKELLFGHLIRRYGR
jgi:Delta3-Delta2-enoyl-CoA isomerase